MNKIIIALIVIAAIAAGWFLLTDSNTNDYVSEVDSEVTELENELVAIEAQAGTLTEADATTAKIQIITRLNTINAAAAASENTQLTPTQKAQLTASLNRLKVALVAYQDTLATVESAADNEQVEARVRRGGSINNSRPLNLIVAAVIADVEETVIDSVQDYESNDTLDTQIELIVAETELEIAQEMLDETNKINQVVGTSTDESTEADSVSDMGTQDGAIETDGATIEVSAEASLGATTN